MTNEKVVLLIKNEIKDFYIYKIFQLIGNLSINETYFYKRKRSSIKDFQLDILDDYFIYFFKTYPNIDAIKVLNKVVKIIQLRMRMFKNRKSSKEIVEWYFDKVFEEKVTPEKCSKASNYELSQLLLNISFIDYDIGLIDKQLHGIKAA